jgi:3-hydroxyacyl-CoA dehydrogenase
MHYAEGRGLAGVVAALERLTTDGLAEPPSDLLRGSAEGGQFVSRD